MNNNFSVRLSQLRHQRGLSQKEAAEALGISQALLSHYEKGIRECGLDFLCKAAAYFDVSCDYLLGISDTKADFGEAFDENESALDTEYRMSTVLRAIMMVFSRFSDSDPGKDVEVKSYFTVMLYQLIINAAKSGCLPKSWIGIPLESASYACNAQAQLLSSRLNNEVSKKHSKSIVEPECIKTVISEAEKMIVKESEKLISKQGL